MTGVCSDFLEAEFIFLGVMCFSGFFDLKNVLEGELPICIPDLFTLKSFLWFSDHSTSLLLILGLKAGGFSDLRYSLGFLGKELLLFMFSFRFCT